MYRAAIVAKNTIQTPTQPGGHQFEPKIGLTLNGFKASGMVIFEITDTTPNPF
jgi:hypothetical protein